MHWTVNASRPGEGPFEQCIQDSLHKLAHCPQPRDGHGIRNRYRVLPRLRMTFGPLLLPDSESAPGNLCIDRRPVSDGWSYRLGRSVIPTGEHTVLEYRTDGSSLRVLHSPWAVDSTYDSPGALQRHRSEGHIAPGGHVRLRLPMGLELSVGQAEPNTPLLAEWTLVDTIAEVEGHRFSILEGLDRLKHGCKVRRCDEWLLEEPGISLQLTG